MGNRTQLMLGTRCGFEANNCLPVTWLALFESQEFQIETRRFEYEQPSRQEAGIAPKRGILATLRRFLRPVTGQESLERSGLGTPAVETFSEECQVAVFKTSQPAALERVQRAIDKLKDKTPIWTCLRPLEILQSELQRCSPEEIIELDMTQLWAMGTTIAERLTQGPGLFTEMLDHVRAAGEQDFAWLDKLVNDFMVARPVSVAKLDSEDKMFALIGSYESEDADRQPYPLEYFTDAYWAGNG
jgi:hypothetical protein